MNSSIAQILASLLLLSCSIFCACSSKDATTDSLTAEEQAKVERITSLAEEYGWEFDSSLSPSERIQQILQIDEDEFVKLAKHVKEVKQLEESSNGN